MKKNKANAFQSSLKLIAKTSFIVLIGVLLSKILSYGYRIIIARYFGPEVYGLLSLAIIIASTFAAVSALGFAEGLLRFIPIYRGREENEKIKYLFRFSTSILIITSLISGLLLFLFSNYISTTFFHDADLARYLKIFSLLVPSSIFAGILLASLRAHEEISWYSFIFNIAQNVIKLSALLILILLGLNSDSATISYLLGIIGMLIISYIVCKYKIPHLFQKSNLPHDEKKLLRREILSYSIPILFFGIISTIFYWIDSFSIGYYKSAVEVGLYNAAVPIAMILAVAPELFMQLFFPMITKAYAKKNIGLIEQLSKQVAKWILIINLPVFAILLVFPGAMLNLLFGADYLAAENALRILAISSVMSSVFIVSNQLVSMMGKSKLVLMNIIIASIINFLLNALLVPMPKIMFLDNSTGLNGAAIATLISVFVFNILFMAQSYKYLSIIPLRKKMLNLFAISLISIGLLIYLRTIFISNNLIVLGALFGVFIIVYVILAIISRSLDEHDISILRSILAKIKNQ